MDPSFGLMIVVVRLLVFFLRTLAFLAFERLRAFFFFGADRLRD